MEEKYSYDQALEKLIKATEEHVDAMKITIESTEEFLKEGNRFFDKGSNIQNTFAHKYYEMERIAPTFHRALNLFTSPLLNEPPGFEGIISFIRHTFLPSLKETLAEYQNGIEKALSIIVPFKDQKIESCTTLQNTYKAFYKLCENIEKLHGKPKKEAKLNQLLYTYKNSRKGVIDAINSTNNIALSFHNSFEHFLSLCENVEKQRSESFNRILKEFAEVILRESEGRSCAAKQFEITLNEVNTRGDVDASMKIEKNPTLSKFTDDPPEMELSFNIFDFFDDREALKPILAKQYAILKEDIFTEGTDVFAEKGDLVEFEMITTTSAKISDGFGGPEQTVPIDMLEILDRYNRKLGKINSGKRTGMRVVIVDDNEDTVKCMTALGELISISKNEVDFI